MSAMIVLQTELSKALIKEVRLGFSRWKIRQGGTVQNFRETGDHNRGIDRGGKRHSCKEKK